MPQLLAKRIRKRHGELGEFPSIAADIKHAERRSGLKNVGQLRTEVWLVRAFGGGKRAGDEVPVRHDDRQRRRGAYSKVWTSCISNSRVTWSQTM